MFVFVDSLAFDLQAICVFDAERTTTREMQKSCDSVVLSPTSERHFQIATMTIQGLSDDTRELFT
jgi:hypothetical protein